MVSAQVHPSGQPEHNAQVHPLDPVQRRAALVPDALSAPSNWWASRSVATATASAEKEGDLARVLAVELAPIDLLCHPGCVSRWHPVSSCNCRSPRVDRPFRHHAVPTAPLSHPVVMAPRPHHRSIGQPPLQQQRHVVRASVLGQVLVDNDAPADPTGMTVRSSRHCAIALLRSNARRSTSSAKTMIRWQRRPVVLPVNRKTWCCRRALLVPPNPNPSREPHPNLWRPCASGARKPLASVSAAEPWSCVQQEKPSKCGRR